MENKKKNLNLKVQKLSDAPLCNTYLVKFANFVKFVVKPRAYKGDAPN